MTLTSTLHGSGYPVAFLHGFTQTAQSWNIVLRHLRTPIQAQLIDAPGHGVNPDAQKNLSEIGAEIIETISTGTLVGYSMGARMALHAALTHSPKITSLCLVSGTAGIEDEQEREQRRHNDEILADKIENIGVDAFLTDWLSQPLFSGLTAKAAQREERLRNTAKGLADSLRYAGTGTQTPLWDQLASLQIPVLLVAGRHDQKFVDLAEKMHERLPNSELHIMDAVGHTAHLENPELFAQIFDAWLQERQP